MYKNRFAVIVSLCVSIFLAACGADVPDGSSPDDVVNSNDPVLATAIPTAVEGDVIEGLAYVEGMDVLILESFPVQVNIRLDLQVGDACTVIGDIVAMRNDTTFVVTVPSIRSVGAECAEEVTHFEEFVALDVLGLPAGEYTVDANGYTDTFALDMDNQSQMPIDAGDDAGGGTMESGQAGIQSATPQVNDNQVSVLISGWLADACTQLGTISESVSEQRIQITVESLRDRDLMCAQVITEFETTYTLTSSLDPGEYTIDINGMFSTSLTIE